MKKWIDRSKTIERDYNKIISKGFITILVYFCISIIWILYSDWLVGLLTSNVETLHIIQSFKGIAFIMMTSLFMFILMNRYNRIIYQLNKDFKESENKRIELSQDKQKNELYQILTSYFTSGYKSSEFVLADIFKYLFRKVEACDLGSFFVVEEEYIRYIDVVGYDKDLLNKLKLPADKIELYTYGINKNQRPEKALSNKLGSAKYKLYCESNPSIHESVYIGLIDGENVKYGISLDISEEKFQKSRATYSEEISKEIKDVQTLLTAMFRIKSMVRVQNMIQADIVSSFVAAIEYHDLYTKGHLEEVAKISDGIGKELALSEESLDELHWAALIHDLGKVVISSDILNKPDLLSDEEFKLVQDHSVNGEMFLNRSESLKKIAKYVRHHHERYDGTGYPDGLKGEEIPLVSRIIAVADSYHAMTSDRPYRERFTHTKALQEIIENDGTQFCPMVVEAFLKMYDKIDL